MIQLPTLVPEVLTPILATTDVAVAVAVADSAVVADSAAAVVVAVVDDVAELILDEAAVEAFWPGEWALSLGAKTQQASIHSIPSAATA